MITVKFYSLLRLLIKQNEHLLAGNNYLITEILSITQNAVPVKFIHKLLDKNGELITGTIILINGKNIHHLKKLDSEVVDGDVVSLFPPGGGG